MTDSAEKYFKDDQSFLFRWTDHGRELCWLDGTTIAFHEELTATFNRLAVSGLPTFPSVVLAMAAVRANWPDVSSRISRLLNALQTSRIPSYAHAMNKHQQLVCTWQSSSRKLTLLTNYAATNAISVTAKAELLASLFDRFESPYQQHEQQQIAAAFAGGLPDSWVAERKGDGEPMTLPATDAEEEEWQTRPPVFHRVLHDVLELVRIAKILASGLHDYSADDLQQKLAGGLAQDIISPAESPLEAPLTAAELLHSLTDDAEFCGFAKLTRHLLAAVSLPRSISRAQTIRNGGISDITNRGQLDKLLLSELAFDDLTLAVRIASNEAMYLRHETPPGPQAELRPVLIDTSLPMWGIPKLYATAMALALRVGANDHLTVACYRPDGNDVVAVELGSREEIAAQLGALSPTEHSGPALAAFQRQIAESTATAEPVLITTSDPLASHTFQRALEQLSLPSLWIICVERDGRLSVMQRTRQGLSVRKKIHLPLEQILQDAEEVRNKDIPDSLPAIFGLEDFPLLLAHQIRPGRVFRWEQQAVSISDDGRLMLWDEVGQGARQLCDDLPKSRKRIACLIERNAAAMEFLLPGGSPEIVRILRPLAVRRTKISQPMWDIDDVRASGSAVIVISNSRNQVCQAAAFDRHDGKEIAAMSSIVGAQRNGRCFYRYRTWDVLVLNAGALGWQKLPEEYQDAADVMELETGHFVQVSHAGKISGLEGQLGQATEELTGTPTGLFGYLPGANAIGLRTEPEHDVLDLKSAEVQTHWRPVRPGCELPGVLDERLLDVRATHWRFRRISTSDGACLRLYGKSGRLYGIVCDGGRIRLRAHRPSTYMTVAATQTNREDEVSPADSDFVEFEHCSSPPNVGYMLKIANWSQGNRAWLDSRGLLHLKNVNTSYPEITLTLRDGELSGWLSTGEVFGEDYYCGRRPEQRGLDRITPEIAWESAIKPFLGAVPWSFHYT